MIAYNGFLGDSVASVCLSVVCTEYIVANGAS